MITVKRFKEIINSCPDNWTIIFRKWEHMSPTPDGSYRTDGGEDTANN